MGDLELPGSERKRADTSAYKRDPRCSFTSGQLRCPLPAVWYSGPSTAKAGYCRLHTWDEQRNMHPADAQEHIRDLLDNYTQRLRETYPPNEDACNG